ncbi:transcriptional regulator, TetR family [Desulfatibacillum aliphaticivorans]|uniref:Transcriptional regulator, TetR family n=1 Tax=Desulfatibacillum aliphaticivorans TaxID=218208 RepID=B8FEW6_DESAL|nr:TetR/AcrR family transcriptional regulator [Desulfatibacillum aliphaticivorans]ACL03643.1 transcriptional regulator, TetR family [Desulfatibacillum aliphaticivorans]
MAKKRAPYKKTQSRKQLIIQAALQCFNEKGFTDSTMEEIRTKANSSYGSVYHHFKNKEQLAAAVYVEGVADFQEGLLKALEGNPGAWEGLGKVVEYQFSWMEANPEWAKYLVVMRHADFMQDAETALEEQNKQAYPALRAFIRRHVKAGALRDLPPDLYATLLLGPCQEYTRFWVFGRAQTPPEIAAEEIVSAAWQALKSPEK